MYNISLNFRIAVNTEMNDLIKIISTNFDGFYEIDFLKRSFLLGDNFVEIVKNDDYDIRLSNEDDDSYLYYKYNIDFYPESEHVLLSNQIKLAKRIRDLFRKETIKAEIISEFEHLL